MRQRLKGRNSVSACDVDAAQQVSQQASKQPSSDTEKVSPAPVQDGPLVSFDAGQQNVLDNQLGVKVQEEPAAVSDRAPRSDVQDAETKTFCGRSLDEVMVLNICGFCKTDPSHTRHWHGSDGCRQRQHTCAISACGVL